MKAGGYAIAGWAVAGDVVIDLNMMRDINIESPIPTDDGYTWTSLREMPRGNSQATGVLGVRLTATSDLVAQSAAQTGTTTKRRREDSPPPGIESSHPSQTAPARLPIFPIGEDAHLRSYDAASTGVGTFLRGPPLPIVEGETPRQPPTNRPRVHSPEPQQSEAPEIQDRQISSDSATSTGGSGSDASSTSNTSSANTPVEGPGTGSNKTNSYSSNADPFGYIPGMSSTPASTSTRPPTYTRVEPTIPVVQPISSSMYPTLGSWTNPITVGAGPGSSAAIRSPFGFNNPSITRQFTPASPFGFPPSYPMRALSVANPIHSHAYVTIGAGMRQKEVDMFTSANALEGTNRLTGAREEKVVPYHIPS